MLEAEQFLASKSMKRHCLPKIYASDIRCIECTPKGKVTYSPKGLSPTRFPISALQWVSESKNWSTSLLLSRLLLYTLNWLKFEKMIIKYSGGSHAFLEKVHNKRERKERVWGRSLVIHVINCLFGTTFVPEKRTSLPHFARIKQL